MYNQITIVGRLVREWKPFKTNSDYTIADNVIAYTNPRRKDQDTSFVQVKVWNKTAELAMKYTGKGSRVMVVGTLEIDKVDQPDGSKKDFVKVNVEHITFLDSTKNLQVTNKEQPKNELEAIDRRMNGEETVDVTEFIDDDSLEDVKLPF